MNPDDFHEAKEEYRKDAKKLPTDDLVVQLTMALENGETMTDMDAKALGLAYALNSREIESHYPKGMREEDRKP